MEYPSALDFLYQFCSRWVLIDIIVKLLKLPTFVFGVLLQLVVTYTQIILVILLYADWIFLDAISKLLEGTCCWLCHWHWLDMVDVAPLFLSARTGKYHGAFIHYCCNPVIKSVCWVKGTLKVIFYKYQLTYFKSEALVTFLSVVGSVSLFSMSNLACSFHSSSTLALLFTCVIHRGIYNNFVSYWVCLLGGLYHVQGKMVTKGHPHMVLYYNNT